MILKNHIITSVEAGNGFDKIQHPFTIKALNKLELGESSPSNNGYVNKSIANITLNVENKNISSKIKDKIQVTNLTTFIKHILEP